MGTRCKRAPRTTADRPCAEATEAFASSRLLDLLRVPRAAERYGETESRFEARLARVWVVFVLVAAAAGFGAHLAAGTSPIGALSIAVAILVVTCPCAFGIASPIAHELVLAGLRKRGMLVRSASFLERAARVRRVVFDKTGTLTTGTLELEDRAAITALELADQRALYELAARSSHPKSAAILQAIPQAAQGLRRSPNGTNVEEIEGKGVVGTFDGHTYRLGNPTWLGATGCDVAFARDDRLLAELSTIEVLRADASAEVRQLASDGVEAWIATGDTRERALDVARKCGVDAQRVRASCSPEDKAELIRELDRDDTLMIGDGMNDGLAIRAASASGTLAVGRTFLAARSDFFLLSAGLGPVRAGLVAARTLRRTLRGNLVWAFTYNAIALGLSYAGWMSPLLAAVLMPISSIVSIALVLRALGRKGSPWKS
ncbi:MAG: HAD-IC family P-type ATPase [Polyangiaceae bacterium]